MEGKSFSTRALFLPLFYKQKISESPDDSELENFLSPNYSKFNVECD